MQIPLPKAFQTLTVVSYKTNPPRSNSYQKIKIKPPSLTTKKHLFTSRLLPRVRNGIIFAHPDLGLLLVHNVLHKYLTCVLCLVLPDPTGIPQLARNTQILAAAYKRVGATPLRGRGDAVGREVVLFTARDRDEPLVYGCVSIALLRFQAFKRIKLTGRYRQAHTPSSQSYW